MTTLSRSSAALSTAILYLSLAGCPGPGTVETVDTGTVDANAPDAHGTDANTSADGGRDAASGLDGGPGVDADVDGGSSAVDANVGTDVGFDLDSGLGVHDMGVIGHDGGTDAFTALPDAFVGVDAWTPPDTGCHAEICDGIDNDCNGVVDNGCPQSLQWFSSLTSSSPIFGPATALNSSAYNYLCPYPTVITGICGSDNGPVRTLGYSCGRVGLVVNTATIPYTYSVQVAPTLTCTTGMGWSGGGAVAWTPYQCPPDTLVDEILGTATTNLGQIQIRCSGWSVVETAGGWVVQRSAVTAMSPRFGTGAGTDFSWIVADDATTGFPGAIRDWEGRVLDLGAYLSIQARGSSPRLVLH